MEEILAEETTDVMGYEETENEERLVQEKRKRYRLKVKPRK